MQGSVNFDGKKLLQGTLDVFGGEPTIESLSITENGTYTAPSGVDGYSPISVNVPIPTPSIESLSITENGTYTAPSGVDGYSPISVNVPIPTPSIESLSITENGTYTAPSGVDGYSPIVVNVPIPTPVVAEYNLKRTRTNNDNGQSVGNVALDNNLVDGKYYQFIAYTTDSTYNINQVNNVLANFTQYPSGFSVYLGAIEVFVTQTYIRTSNRSSAVYITIYEIPDSRIT